ncbi:MAG: hypothetical protein HC933_00800 [Pleurocapsa sp. SU_196_0]|nr:hypothetical protein [Pleurocapsa sp. SU_196_0]
MNDENASAEASMNHVQKRTNDLIALEIGYAAINKASLSAQLEQVQAELALERKARQEAASEKGMSEQPVSALPTATGEPDTK